MKLYTSGLSPYGQRVKIALRAKGLLDRVEIIDQRPQTPQFRALNPTGKIPALEVDGRVIPESEVIVEFLEDAFPTPALKPADPAGRAKVRLLTRICDLYVSPALSPLFFMLAPDKRDAARIEEAFTRQADAFRVLEAVMDGDGFAHGDALTQADCALAPVLFFLQAIVPVYGRTPFEGADKTRAYFQAISSHAHVAPAIGELTDALKTRMGRG